MHFIPEAFYRRPLEPRSLVYSRGGTAVTMGIAFLAFVGYLASQIYYDRHLILLSSETIVGSTNTADVEFCVQNSTLTIIQCDVMYVNWSTYTIPDCSSRLFRKGNDDPTNHCYVFETNGSYTMGVSGSNADSVKRFDFYWHIDSIPNVTYASMSIPAVALKLYDPSFSTWKIATIGNTPVEDQTITNIRLGSQRATTYINATSSIFYTPQKYREIVPGSSRALLGFDPDYIDIITLDVTQQNWPLLEASPPGKLSRSAYQGLVSIQLSQSTIDVKTEVRQHTFLAAVALAGGCYGVLTTLYILLFGMTRLTPWGLVHHIPVFISNHRHYKKNDKVFEEALILENAKGEGKRDYDEEEAVSIDDIGDDDNKNRKPNKKKNGSFTTKLIPWFFRSNMKGKAIVADSDTNILKRMMTQSDQNKSKNNNSDHESMMALGRRTSLHVDNDSRTQLPDESNAAHAVLSNEAKQSIEELNELSTTSDFFLNKRHSSPASVRNQAVGSPTSIFFNSSNDNNNNDNNKAFSPTITKRPSLSSDIMLIETSNSQPYQQQSNQDSVQILTEVIKQEREKSKELATRVDELEVILSQYFINTAYLDQLRTRREQSFIDGMNDDVNRRTRRPSNDEL